MAREQTYINPIPKMAVRPSFFDTGNCSDHNIGIGRIMTAMSIKRLMVPTATDAATRLPHTASGAVRSQWAKRGSQRRSAVEIGQRGENGVKLSRRGWYTLKDGCDEVDH